MKEAIMIYIHLIVIFVTANAAMEMFEKFKGIRAVFTVVALVAMAVALAYASTSLIHML